MSDEENIVRCEALTKAATRCKNKAEPGSVTCRVHRSSALKLDTQRPSQERFEERDLSDRELRERLMAELDDLIIRVQGISPEYSPPPFSPEKMVDLLDEHEEDVDSSFRLALLKRLRGSINEDILDIETWKGAWYMVNYTIEYQGDIVKRRLKGDYETDAWGLDWEFIEAVRPFLDFMYKFYWRVETTGIEHISDYERALLVANHSGQFPWDGAMLMTALLNEHPAQRLVRNLYSNSLPTLPFVSSILVKMGQALDSVENGVKLLEQEELVGVFPEGYNGVGKLFRNRYKLSRFGRDGFVKMALQAQAPIIPVSIVGAEETYITLGRSSFLSRLTGLPYFPISLRFPWLGLLGVVPLPTKWYIDIGQPITIDDFGPDAAVNPALLSQLTDKIRNVIQVMVNNRLEQRRAIFF